MADLPSKDLTVLALRAAALGLPDNTVVRFHFHNPEMMNRCSSGFSWPLEIMEQFLNERDGIYYIVFRLRGDVQ